MMELCGRASGFLEKLRRIAVRQKKTLYQVTIRKVESVLSAAL